MSLPNHICSICGQEWDDKQSHLCTDSPPRPAPRTGYTPCDWPECDRSPADGWALFRVNPTGQTGVFMCSEHAGRRPEEVADVMDAVADAMSEKGDSVTWADGTPLTTPELRSVALLRIAGCSCAPLPLLGYRPGVGPRCRLCNVVAPKNGRPS